MSASLPPADTAAPPSLEYGFPWDLREHVRVQGAVLRNRRRTRWGRVLIWGGLSVAVPVFGFWLLEIVRGKLAASDLLWGAAPAATMAYFVWGHRWIVARTLQKRVGGPGARIALAVHDAGVTSTSSQITFTLPWASIERVVETRDLLLFYVAANAATYLPRRAVPLESEWRPLIARVDGYMRERGGVIRDPGRRHRLPIAAGVTGLLILAFVAVLAWLPPAQVVRGDELRPRHLRVLREEGLLRPGEEVYYFYSDASWSIRSDVNLLTSSGIVSHARTRSGVYRYVVPYEEIRQVELFREPLRSIIEVTTTADDEVILYASPRGDGDQAFADRLREEWRARVPVDVEERVER